LSAKTAWLYTQFLDKNSSKLVGFNFVNPTFPQARDQQNALQFGIWSGMGYNTPDIITLSGWDATYVTTTLTNLLASSLSMFQTDVTNNIWFGTGDIKVMSLRSYITRTDGSIRLTGYEQDQLVRMNTHVTPELPTFASACTVVGCGLLARILSFFRKRSRSTVGA
jgi:hypothetical protein